MSHYNNQQEFEVIFEGPTDYSEDTLRKLRGVFISELEFSIEETIRALNQFPLTIAKSSVEEDASKLLQILELAGGKVLLVRPGITNKPNKPSLELSLADESIPTVGMNSDRSAQAAPTGRSETTLIELDTIPLELDTSSLENSIQPQPAEELSPNLNELTISFDEPPTERQPDAKEEETPLVISTEPIQLNQPTRNSKISAFQINYDERHTLADFSSAGNINSSSGERHNPSATGGSAILPWDVIGAITLGAGLLMLGNWWYFRPAPAPTTSQPVAMALSTPATTLPPMVAASVQSWRGSATVAGAPATVQLATTNNLPSSIQLQISPSAPSSMELEALAQGRESPAWIRRIDLDNVGLISAADGKFKGSGRSRVSVQSQSVARVVAMIYLEGSWDQSQKVLSLTVRSRELSSSPDEAALKLSPLIQGRYQIELSDVVTIPLSELPTNSK